MTVINPFSFDTNILIYSIDLRDTRKHQTCRRIVNRCAQGNGAVALQCLSEFYQASTRKSILPHALASGVVEEARSAMRVVPPSEADLVRAMQYHQLHKLQFFDALMRCTIERAGCTTFFSEDFQHNRTIGTLKIVNPFLITIQELDSLLA